jgi:hypothetical protein
VALCDGRIPEGYSPVWLLPAVGPDVVVVVGRGSKALPAQVAGVRLFSYSFKGQCHEIFHPRIFFMKTSVLGSFKHKNSNSHAVSMTEVGLIDVKPEVENLVKLCF